MPSIEFPYHPLIMGGDAAEDIPAVKLPFSLPEIIKTIDIEINNVVGITQQMPHSPMIVKVNGHDFATIEEDGYFALNIPLSLLDDGDGMNQILIEAPFHWVGEFQIGYLKISIDSVKINYT